VRNCSTDEGRPLGIGLQEQVPNHLWRLWPKTRVVNAKGKGPEFTGSGDRQEEDCKGTTDEVSKRNLRRCPKPRLVTTAGQTPTIPAYGWSGIRHERWPELAMRRLNGTWEPEIPMSTEKLQVEDPRGREYGCGVSGADCLVVVMKRGNARGAKGTGHSRHDRVVNWQQEELLGRCEESVRFL
jgi:hypothetical protein